jgi:hypothetical protein
VLIGAKGYEEFVAVITGAFSASGRCLGGQDKEYPGYYRVGLRIFFAICCLHCAGV